MRLSVIIPSDVFVGFAHDSPNSATDYFNKITAPSTELIGKKVEKLNPHGSLKLMCSNEKK